MIQDGAALDLALHGVVSDPRAYLLRFYPKLTIPPLDQVAGEQYAPLVAEVHAGIWVARCPCNARVTQRRPDGPGGVVWLDQPLVWCPRCQNRAVGRAWRRVVLPADADGIARVLGVRPERATQNWLITETVDDLVAENLEHGLEVA